MDAPSQPNPSSVSPVSSASAVPSPGISYPASLSPTPPPIAIRLSPSPPPIPSPSVNASTFAASPVLIPSSPISPSIRELQSRDSPPSFAVASSTSSRTTTRSPRALSSAPPVFDQGPAIPSNEDVIVLGNEPAGEMRDQTDDRQFAPGDDREGKALRLEERLRDFNVGLQALGTEIDTVFGHVQELEERLQQAQDSLRRLRAQSRQVAESDCCRKRNMKLLFRGNGLRNTGPTLLLAIARRTSTPSSPFEDAKRCQC